MGVRVTSIDAIPGEENFHGKNQEGDGNYVYSHLGKIHEISMTCQNGNVVFWKCEIGKERGSVNIEKDDDEVKRPRSA